MKQPLFTMRRDSYGRGRGDETLCDRTSCEHSRVTRAGKRQGLVTSTSTRQFLCHWVLIHCLVISAWSLVIPLAADPPISPTDLPRIPPTPATIVLSTFQLRPGIRLDLVAAEPLIVDPIAMCF